MVPAINFEGETFSYFIHDYHHSYATRLYVNLSKEDVKKGFLLDTTACCEQHQDQLKKLIGSESLLEANNTFYQSLCKKAKQEGWQQGTSFSDKPILTNITIPPIRLHKVEKAADFAFKLHINSLNTKSQNQPFLQLTLDDNVTEEQIEDLIQHCGGEHVWRDAGIEKPLLGGINIYHKDQLIMQHGCCSLIDRWRTWFQFLEEEGASPWNGHGPYWLFQKTEENNIQIGYWKQIEPDCWNDFVSDIAQEYFDDKDHDEELDSWLPEYAHFEPVLDVSSTDYKALLERLEKDITAFLKKIENYLEKKEMENLSFLEKVKLKYGNREVMTQSTYKLSTDLRKWLNI